MLIALPISRADYKLALALCQWLEKLGGVRPHSLLLAFSKSCPVEERKKIEKVAIKLTDKLHIFDIPSEDERGWPQSANSVFHDVCLEVHRQKGFGHLFWYFFEADNVPLVPEWADKLEMEFILAKMPFMGVRHATKKSKMVDGELTVYEDGEHMVGTGIYPSDAFQRVQLIKHLTKTDVPFDVFIQYETVPFMHHTSLIQHNWSSEKYKKSGNQITCSSSATRPGIARPLRKDAVVVHGVKDGSLINLLREAA